MPRLIAGDRRLSGAQFKEFHQATLDAFDDVQDLRRVLLFGVDKQLALISALTNPLDTLVFDVIAKADTEGWSAELLQALRGTRPTNQKLLVFAQKFELAPTTPERSALELLIQEGDEFLDVVRWRTLLAESEARVCRVERNGTALGTGFLVAPSVVMTNYHVVEDVITTTVDAGLIKLRFDYKILADGVVVNPGQVYPLAANWDIDHSPYSPLDTQVDPATVPGSEALDYALLRVEGTPGSEPVAGVNGADPEGPPRGFVPIPPTAHDWTTRKGLMILQHPEGQPLKLAIRSDGVTATLPAGASPTRVRYSTRTEAGSSGSPCFDLSWNLVALHHSGDPKYSQLKVKPEWNEGIPLAAILEALDKNGVRGQLGAQETDE